MSLPQSYAGKALVLRTAFGDIRVRPYRRLSPGIVTLVLQLAAKGTCPGCRFYRNEIAPTKAQGWGPPYGLLQVRTHGMQTHTHLCT